MLGLTSGELTLVVLLVAGVVSARFWPAVGARIAERLAGPPKDEGRVPTPAPSNQDRSS